MNAHETDIDELDSELVEDEVTDDEEESNGKELEAEASAEAAAESDADEEVQITIGDEKPDDEPNTEAAPQWVRELRKNHRELQKRNRELEEQVKATGGAAPNVVELGKKPTLEGCDYDAEKYDTEIEAWFQRRQQVEAEANKKKEAELGAQRAWQDKLDAYGKAKTALKVRDYEDVEAVAQGTFSTVQQGIIIQGSENPAVLIYAMGKNPTKAKELAAEKDPVKFAFAIAKLETQLKVTPKKSPPPPEGTIKGSAPKSGAVDSTLDRLRAQAAKTGDYTKVVAYKRNKK